MLAALTQGSETYFADIVSGIVATAVEAAHLMMAEPYCRRLLRAPAGSLHSSGTGCGVVVVANLPALNLIPFIRAKPLLSRTLLPFLMAVNANITLAVKALNQQLSAAAAGGGGNSGSLKGGRFLLWDTFALSARVGALVNFGYILLGAFYLQPCSTLHGGHLLKHRRPCPLPIPPRLQYCPHPHSFGP